MPFPFFFFVVIVVYADLASGKIWLCYLEMNTVGHLGGLPYCLQNMNLVTSGQCVNLEERWYMVLLNAWNYVCMNGKL